MPGSCTLKWKALPCKIDGQKQLEVRCVKAGLKQTSWVLVTAYRSNLALRVCSVLCTMHAWHVTTMCASARCDGQLNGWGIGGRRGGTLRH